MKNLVYFALLGLLLLSLSACESGGKIVLKNQTSFPAYASVDGADEVTIEAGVSHSFDVETETQNFFTGEVERRVKVKVIGETFSLYDDYDEVFTDSTMVTVKAGKTTTAFLNPNRASIKITNQHSLPVAYVEIWQHYPLNQYRLGILEDIPTGTTKFLRVPYATPTSNFYYKVNVMMQNGDLLVYGGPGTVLGNDEQFHIILTETK
ncbi:MAG TPA: hypothetical protein PKI59_01700 [Candidatus Cloacimonadota bacterium]|nr:hypothetical protein [Candidatus Cloacimonadota bacterium]